MSEALLNDRVEGRIRLNGCYPLLPSAANRGVSRRPVATLHWTVTAVGPVVDSCLSAVEDRVGGCVPLPADPGRVVALTIGLKPKSVRGSAVVGLPDLCGLPEG